MAERGRGRRPGTWQHRPIHQRSHQRSERPEGGGHRGTIHRRHAGPCQRDPRRHQHRAFGGDRLGERRRHVRQRRRRGNGVALEPSRHPQYRQQRRHSRRVGDSKWRERISSRRPTALPDGTTAANAPHANLAEIGAIFNDLRQHFLGGINDDNTAQAYRPIRQRRRSPTCRRLMTANPTAVRRADRRPCRHHRAAARARADLHQPGRHQPDAGRASNDNLLDIIDIVQGDTNLANMANQGGVIGGFTPFPDALNPTPKYIDNDAQTNVLGKLHRAVQLARAAARWHARRRPRCRRRPRR